MNVDSESLSGRFFFEDVAEHVGVRHNDPWKNVKHHPHFIVLKVEHLKQECRKYARYVASNDVNYEVS